MDLEYFPKENFNAMTVEVFNVLRELSIDDI